MDNLSLLLKSVWR